ncbi:MAG: hypothetical protein ACXVAS_10715 [Vulcanimicrobiaceae bacterium]
MYAGFIVTIVATLTTATAPLLQQQALYSLTATEEQSIQIDRQHSGTSGFATPSEAAYAASLRYHSVAALVEFGTKIYQDISGTGRITYSYGSLIYGQKDSQTGDPDITYDPNATDGHFVPVGLWHMHPFGTSRDALWGHYDEIEQTHQAVWTTIGTDFYVQYWNGTKVVPEWGTDGYAIPALCHKCSS